MTRKTATKNQQRRIAGRVRMRSVGTSTKIANATMNSAKARRHARTNAMTPNFRRAGAAAEPPGTDGTADDIALAAQFHRHLLAAAPDGDPPQPALLAGELVEVAGLRRPSDC